MLEASLALPFCRVQWNLSSFVQSRLAVRELARPFFPAKVVPKCFFLHRAAKPLFPARLDKMRHCDMGPQKFTYCPLRRIFDFFRYHFLLKRP